MDTRSAYRSIKERVITCGFVPGERINVEQLAEELRVSITPVREILQRLEAEHLVELIPRIGFFMKSLSERELRNLYEYNLFLLNRSIDAIKRRDLGNDLEPDTGKSEFDYLLAEGKSLSPKKLVRITSKLFYRVAARSNNQEIERALLNMNDRLHYVRLGECQLLPDAPAEIKALCQRYGEANWDEFGKLLQVYHDNRHRILTRLMGVLYLQEPQYGDVGDDRSV